MSRYAYARIVAAHPYAVAAGVVALTALCFTSSISFGKYPDFSDPQLGFETRGTELSKRLTTWENIRKALRPGGTLIANPAATKKSKATTAKPTPTTVAATTTIPVPKAKPTGPPSNQLTPPRSVPLKGGKPKGAYRYWEDTVVSDADVGRVAWMPKPNASHIIAATDRLAETLEEEDWASLMRPEPEEVADDEANHDHDHDDDSDHDSHDHLGPDGFFCDGLSPSYSRVVATSSALQNSSLLSLEGLQAVCRLQDYFMSVDDIQEVCDTVRKNQCCPVWSLPNYVAMLNNRTNCSMITEHDVAATVNILKECHGLIASSLARNRPINASGPCAEFGPVFNMLYYLIESHFNPGSASPLTTAMLFLPVAHSSSVLPYYNKLDFNKMSSGFVTISAADFGLKGVLFDQFLVDGTFLMIGSFMVILLSLWTYTGSLFTTICSVLSVFMSLVIAHSVYTFIFNINFFPFMNLLAVVLAIGIGSDDAFVYCAMWRCVQDGSDSCSASLVSAALRAAAPSMTVTSLTTAAALFANCISPITAINCFSIFAGTAVLVNLFLMLSWLPACVLLSDRCCCPPMLPLQWRPYVNSRIHSATELLTQLKALVDRSILQCVVLLRWVWVLVLGGIAIAAAVVVLHYPRLRLPETKTFPLFSPDHPFEQYDTYFKHKFWFERDQRGNPWSDDGGPLPLTFVWGVDPTDNGNPLDPASRGHLVYQKNFDVTSQESQKWLEKFCRELRRQPFYEAGYSTELGNCFIESFKTWMTKRRCKDLAGVDQSPCCEASEFPYSRRVFRKCVKEATVQLYASPRYIFTPSDAGIKFSPSGEIKAVVVEFESNYTYSNSYTEMSAFYQKVERWFEMIKAEAPVGLQGGWFVSDLAFWDLQTALTDGTQAAILLSLGVALTVIFLSTLNALLSLFTVLTIGAIMFVTVAILVLLGWRLNVLESVAVTTAIGLSVDFSLHYAVHYRQSGEELRQPAAVHSLTRMIGPTAMGAVTTGAAGGFMLFSSALPYIQIGVLMVVLISVSWVYSTVFLMALLSIAGPQRGCGQFRRPSPGSWCQEPAHSKPVAPAMWSDTTLSTSSGPGEMHELDALTRGQRRRRPRSQSPALPEDVEELAS